MQLKIILSRKGFDSSTGGCPSPIFPDGTLFSLPIPNNDDLSYDKLKLFGKEGDVCRLIESLGGKCGNTKCVHLDPDIRADIVERQTDNFIGAFGQSHTALAHLNNNDVDVGDIFLFFGWFREVENINGKWKFKKEAKDKHIIFGYLQIGKIVELPDMEKHETINNFPSLKEHPHYTRRKEYGTNNCIYVASEGNLKINDEDFGIPSFGTFDKLDEQLMLTKKDSGKRSIWELPNCFSPDNFTYHKNEQRWKEENDKITLDSVGRGQEFVIKIENNPEVLKQFLEPIFTYHKKVITAKHG